MLTSSIDTDALKSTLISPTAAFPWLVVITRAPFAAPDPHRAVAAAPLSTVTLAISLAGISFKRDDSETPAVLEPKVELDIGTPSIIINGELEPNIVFWPRIWT